MNPRIDPAAVGAAIGDARVVGKPNARGAVIRDQTERFAHDRGRRERVADLEAQRAASGPAA